jgi:hypothetical protein
VLESPVGQQESVLADALHRNLLPDGRAILEALHKEGMLKKVSTEHIIMTPTANSTVRLDELNRLVREMEQGEGARKRMAELDASAGLVDPQTKRRAEAEFKSQQQQKATNQVDTLDDKTLATNMLSQAKRMEVEARGLIAEAARMKKEAERMFPGVIVTETSDAPAVQTKARGRKRAVAADAVQ